MTDEERKRLLKDADRAADLGELLGLKMLTERQKNIAGCYLYAYSDLLRREAASPREELQAERDRLAEQVAELTKRAEAAEGEMARFAAWVRPERDAARGLSERPVGNDFHRGMKLAYEQVCEHVAWWKAAQPQERE